MNSTVFAPYPIGTPGRLASELEIVLDHADRALRLVLVCQGDPAFDLHRHAAAGELVRISDQDLVMDAGEIAELLRETSVADHDDVVSAVQDHTLGWACGVRRAAVTLVETSDVRAAMVETDRANVDYLTHEVLAAMPTSVRRLLVWTSVVEVVPPGVVRAVLGPHARSAIDRTIALTGLVRRHPDGSLTCHPLLRAAARARLVDEPAEEARLPRERVVSWFADHGAPEAAVELSVSARDWVRAASVLVQAHAVPRLVTGTASAPVRRAAEVPEVLAAEPLLRAAVALARGELTVGEEALDMRPSQRDRSQPAHLLAEAFLQLEVARLSGRLVTDASVVQRTRALLARLTVSTADDLADLTVGLDALAGAVEVSTGQLERGGTSLTRGADHPDVGHSEVASNDCAGQLALLEAYRGNLGRAAARAWAVLATAADPRLPGVAHAEIALAWVHTERAELPEARMRLSRGTRASTGATEPWLDLARHLVEARVLIAAGRSDEAMRRTFSRVPDKDAEACSEWLAALLSSVSAEAMLAAGEPQQALALVTSGLAAGSAERAVLTAAARRDIGDVRGAAAALASAAYDLPGAPRAIQLRGWVLEARLADDRGQVERARQLVARALRAASAEELRRPLVPDAAWLRWFLDRNGELVRDHRSFVASLFVREQAASSSAAPPVPGPPDQVLDPLTQRETEVLELLAQMCSTEEIADALFVSANTVKTHLKGIFRKYGVNRRVDAVRRGRDLGVC